MTDTFQKGAAPTTRVSTELNSLANGSGATATAEFDNTATGTRHIHGEFTCDFAAAGTTTGRVDVYLLVGTTTAELSTTAKTSNMRFIGTVELNGTTAVRKTLRVSDLPSRFWKERVVNNSGSAMASSGNTIKFTGINFTDT